MENEPDLSSLIDGAGPVAGLVVLVVALAVVLLWWSMTRQFKKISPDLPSGKDEKRLEQEFAEIAPNEDSDGQEK